MADPLTKVPRAAWKHVPEAFADEPGDDECMECGIEIAMGWRRPADVIRDGEAALVDVCSRCGRAGFVVGASDDPGASPLGMRPL